MRMKQVIFEAGMVYSRSATPSLLDQYQLIEFAAMESLLKELSEQLCDGRYHELRCRIARFIESEEQRTSVVQTSKRIRSHITHK